MGLPRYRSANSPRVLSSSPHRMADIPASARLNYGPLRMRLYETAPELTVMSTTRLPDDWAGVYDRERDVILIDRDMTYTHKKATLVHELVHRSHGDDGHAREHRCRLETARLLIDRDEYARAEIMYEGDIWLIAEELDVPVEVVRDYRGWLHEQEE